MSNETARDGATYAMFSEALRLGTMTVSQAQTDYRASVKHYGADDAQSIGIQRAITRHLRAVNSAF